MAGSSNQAPRSIVINATGIGLQNTISDSCVIAPIRNIADPVGLGQLVYNTTTKEVQYVDDRTSYAEYYWNSNITYSTPNAGLDTFGPVWASPAPLAQAGLSTSDWTFTAQTAELQYTGTETREFSINANWCWEMGLTAAAAEDVAINLAINGTPQAKPSAYARLNDSVKNYPRNAGMCAFISLAPNDTIRMYAKVVTDPADTHYYRNFNFIVRNI